MKSRTNCENPSCNPLQEACFGFPIAACDSTNCSESRPVSLKNVPKTGRDMYSGEKRLRESSLLIIEFLEKTYKLM
jgi:hypothetical protein